MKYVKTEKILYFIFLIMGLAFLIVGIAICSDIFNYDNKEITTAKIVDITSKRDSDGDVSYNTIVSYTVNGRKYESFLNAYASSYYEGKDIEIYYDKNNPLKIGTKTTDLLSLMFPGFGLIFFCVGAIPLIISEKRKILNKRLVNEGTRIYANFVEAERNMSYSVNDYNPYRIICEWDNPSDSKKYLFKSENIWFDPNDTISEYSMDVFPVYVDMEDMDKYFIDISELLDKVVDLR